MKLRRCSLVCAVLFCSAVAVEAKEPDESRVRVDKESSERERVAAVLAPPAAPTPLQNISGNAVFKQAYTDVFRILSDENECSRFFGGAGRAARAFNDLAAQLKTERLENARMAGRMSGDVSSVRHMPTGFSYRLFAKAVINRDGPFYRRKAVPGDPEVPNVGSFEPNTREARALILLHELGHLLKGASGGWLLADDGKDVDASERNTALVEKKCGTQIRSLADGARMAKATKETRPAGPAAAAVEARAERDSSQQ